ncbi:MAG: patatin-like phospholipase family protein [Burkholderiales bacterium]|nr:patatin-like phospholipase family protein [Burkholderiales bacterium]
MVAVSRITTVALWGQVRKAFGFGLCVMSLVCGAPALADATPTPAPQPMRVVRPKIGLVLSGGGARGLAHVGVLKVLERERIPVDVIAGTSMGAIVGGLYAAGLSAEQIEAEVLKLNWNDVFATRVDRRELSQRRKEQDFDVSPLIEIGVGSDGLKAPLGSVSSRGLESHLRRLTLSARQVKDFDQLPTPFRAVATDMETGQALILKEGDLATALRSSMSVPGVFAPVEVNGHILGDGGLVDNTPVDVARAMGAQRLIVVNLGTPLGKRDTLQTLTGVTSQMINILTEQNVQQSLRTLHPDDVLIAPDLDSLTAADFDRAREIMLKGEMQAEALVLRMQDLKVSEAEYAAWQAQRKQRQTAPAPLAFVRFEGSKLTQPEVRSDMLASQPGQVFDLAKAERDVTALAATGDYQRTDYRLVRGPQGEGLVFDLEDKPWGPNYLQMGLDFSADNRGRSVFNLKLVHNRHWLDEHGTEWRNFLRLGTTPTLSSELYRPMDWHLPDGLSGFVAVSGQTLRRTLSYYNDPNGKVTADIDRAETGAALEAGLNWRELGEWRLGWVVDRYRDSPNLTSSQYNLAPGVQRWQEQGWRLHMVFDQLDHAYFPTQGWRLEGKFFQGQHIQHGQDADSDGQSRYLDVQGQFAKSWGMHTLLGYARLALSDGLQPVVPRWGLGGFHQLSGYGPFQVSGPELALFRLGYQVRVTDLALTRGVFLGASVEMGNAWSQPQDVWRGTKRKGFSWYVGADTPFGPVYTALVTSPGVGSTVMLFVGRP